MGGGKKDRYIFVEQVSLLVKHIPSMIWLTLLTAAVISLILIGKVPARIPVLWFGGMLLYCAVRLWHFHSLKHEPITVDNVYGHGAFFVGFSFVSGAIWGVLGLILPILTDPYLMVLTAILLCGMVAGSVSFLSIYKPAYFAFAIPCAVPFALRCILSNQEVPVAIGILLLMFLAINLFHSHLTQVNVLNGIDLVLENKELIEKLKYEKSNADAARRLSDQNNRAKSRFLAAASHDLRQPLHAMGFFVEALRHERKPQKIHELSHKVGQTSEALRKLLTSLLDISKIEAGVVEPRRSHFILNEMLQEICQEYAGRAQRKGLSLDFIPCHQAVYSDKEMIGRILRNLVSNAIRYTERGFVKVSCETEADHMIIYVADSGAGIPDNCREDVFTEFFRINDDPDKESKGLGLGLSIVEGLCRLLDHKIDLQSEVGVGSVFSVKIPLGQLQRVTAKADELEAWPRNLAANVLMLNSEDNSRESISKIMRIWGHKVADFKTGAEVMAFLRSQDFTPDLVISDVELKDVSGMEIIGAIRDKVDKKIPAIVMTGVGDGAEIDLIRSNGFSILQKPVQPAKLRSTVTYLMRGESQGRKPARRPDP